MVLKQYSAYLLLERGLSENTLQCYLDDVGKLIRYLDDNNLKFTDVTLEILHNFIAELHDLGISSRSQARIISGIKSFFKFLKLENHIDHNPTLLLESPRIGRKLPDVLSVEEIDNMIDCIDLSTNEGQRNRAIIETLYSCGLRVSELINLEINKIFLQKRGNDYGRNDSKEENALWH